MAKQVLPPPYTPGFGRRPPVVEGRDVLVDDVAGVLEVGLDSEVFYLFPQVEHDKAFGAHCHPHCDCGRFVEIGNSVFMQYRRTTVGFEALPQPNVDFGGGLERLGMAAIDAPEVFAVELLAPIVNTVREMAHHADPDRRALRIVADHARAATLPGA
jgi:alanyl-tRNA synthetase